MHACAVPKAGRRETCSPLLEKWSQGRLAAATSGESSHLHCVRTRSRPRPLGSPPLASNQPPSGVSHLRGPFLPRWCLRGKSRVDELVQIPRPGKTSLSHHGRTASSGTPASGRHAGTVHGASLPAGEEAHRRKTGRHPETFWPPICPLATQRRSRGKDPRLAAREESGRDL